MGTRGRPLTKLRTIEETADLLSVSPRTDVGAPRTGSPYGDPRDPKIDPIDWVERIPLSETRNYVQRVLENLQVYRVRFGSGSKLLIEADLRRGASSK